MKKIWLSLLIVPLFLLNGWIQSFSVQAAPAYEVAYFYTPDSNDSTLLTPTITTLTEQGVTVNSYPLDDLDNQTLLAIYRTNYLVDSSVAYDIYLFAGSAIYTAVPEIQNRVTSNTLFPVNETTLIPLKKIVYFYSPTCGNCQQLADTIDTIPSLGIHVTKYDVTRSANMSLKQQYEATYFVPFKQRATPLLFVGDQFYTDVNEIKALVADPTFLTLAAQPLKTLLETGPVKIEGIMGLLSVIGSGFLDGFNPCAIAMLLLFISLLSSTKKKATMIGISLTYIGSLFISYLALGTILYSFIYQLYDTNLIFYISLVMTIGGFFLFGLNLWDFFAAKEERYGDIKNQLPSGIKRFNKQIINFFTKQINEGGKLMYVLTFFLGLIISLTEFLCTGQIYLFIILNLVNLSPTLNQWNLFLLVIYNLAFILPLVIVAVAAIKTQSVMGASDKVRRNMHWIKLFNALLFLVIAIYYLFKLI